MIAIVDALILLYLIVNATQHIRCVLLIALKGNKVSM